MQFEVIFPLCGGGLIVFYECGAVACREGRPSEPAGPCSAPISAMPPPPESGRAHGLTQVRALQKAKEQSRGAVGLLA